MTDAEDRIACFKIAVLTARVVAGMEEEVGSINETLVGGESARKTIRQRNMLKQEIRFFPRMVSDLPMYCGLDPEPLRLATETIRSGLEGPTAFDLRMVMEGINTLHGFIDDPQPPASGEVPLIVLTTDGYVTIRGPKRDLTAFVRHTEGDIDYEIYPPGKAPPSGTDEEVGELHQAAVDTIALDGGQWTTEAGTNPDLEGIAEDIYEITGTRVRLGYTQPKGGPIGLQFERVVRKNLGLPGPEEDEGGEDEDEKAG